MRYLNGSIGPRPPFTDLKLDHTVPLVPGWAGNFFGAYWVGGANKVVVIMDSGVVYASDDPTGSPHWTLVGNLGFTPSCACVNGTGLQVGSVQLQTAGNPNIGFAAYVDPIANTITPITGQPMCDWLVAYSAFVVAGLDKKFAPTLKGSSVIWFSDLTANITDIPGQSWTSAQGNLTGVVGIGDFEPISGLFTQKDTLVIAKQGGEWWSLTGIPSGPPTIRRIDKGLDFLGVGGSIRQSNIWYPNGRSIATFTGSTTSTSDAPDLGDFGGDSDYRYGTFVTVSELENTDEFMLTALGTGLTGKKFPWVFLHHGMQGTGTSSGWSRHLLSYQADTVNLGSNFSVHVGNAVTWLFLQEGNNMPVQTYQFDIRQEIPYQGLNASFPAGNPVGIYQDMGTGAPVTGTFQIPEWWSPDGWNAHVHEVFVDLDFDAAAWQNAADAGSDPAQVVGFSINVEALNLKGAESSRTSRTLTWSPDNRIRPVPASNTNMLRTRASFRVGDQGASSGFQIKLSNMRGIQVWRIVGIVNIDLSEP